MDMSTASTKSADATEERVTTQAPARSGGNGKVRAFLAG